ncbi:MBG domain-containing protein, partial [Jiangella asiatica]
AAFCWGSDGNGMLGNGPGGAGDQVSPSPVVTPAGVEGWSTLTAGRSHTCGVSTDGAAFCWGSDGNGMLGNGPGGAGDQVSPSPVVTPAGVDGWSTLTAAAANHTCGVSTDDAAFCWGADDFGQLGNGPGVTGDQVSPSPVVTPAGVDGWSTVSANVTHTCGVSTDGAAFCWGDDDLGRLGNGPGVTEDQVSPSPVVTPTGVDGWSTISAGVTHTCGVSTDDDAFCWGDDGSGQLGNGAELTGNQPSPSLVNRAAQQIGFGALPDVTYGVEPFEVSASASSGLPVSFSADGECTVDGLTVTVTGAGECTVTASQDGDDAWLPADPVSRSFTIAKADQSIEFAPLSDVTYGVEPFEVSASASSGLPVSFSADGECTVDGSTVSVTGAGTCTVTASQDGNANWSAAEPVSRTFTIAKADQSIEFAPLSDVTYGDPPFDVEASATSGLQVQYDAAGMCSIEGSTVTVTGAGECTVTARQPGNANWSAAAPVERTFTIEGAPAMVEVTEWEHVYDGEPHGVTVTTDPEGLEVEVTYDGDVDEPIDAGSYEVVVTVTDPDYETEPVTGTMTIAKADQEIALDAPESVVFGDGAFEVTVEASSGLPVELTASGVCAADGSTVTPSGAGECVLTAEQPGDDNWNAAPTATATVVVDPASTSTVLTGPDRSSLAGEPVTFTAEVTAPEGTGVPGGAVVFTVDDADEGVEVPLDGDGVAAWSTGDLAVGEHNVAASYAGQGDHAASASEPVEHTVVTAELTMTGLPAEVMAGDEVTVGVTGFVPGEEIGFVLHSDPVTVAAVTADAVGAGSVTFTVPDVPAGEHLLVATGADSELSVEAGTQIVEAQEPTPPPEPELPDTGSSLSPVTTGGLVLAGLGLAGLGVAGLVSRRRRPSGEVA